MCTLILSKHSYLGDPQAASGFWLHGPKPTTQILELAAVDSMCIMEHVTTSSVYTRLCDHNHYMFNLLTKGDMWIIKQVAKESYVCSSKEYTRNVERVYRLKRNPHHLALLLFFSTVHANIKHHQ